MTQQTLTHATATFETEGWTEDLITQLEGESKITRVTTASLYAGDLEGKSGIAYLLYYMSAGYCAYIGFERFVGKLGGRSGSFVLRHDALFADGAATSRWTVVEGSGTGDLVGLRGSGGFVGRHGVKTTTATLDYDFA
jgi:Protein of unknown function (DUF3224)